MTKSKKKILMLHQGAELYGSDKVFFEVIKTLKDYFDVLVVLDNNGPLVSLIESTGITVYVHDLSVLRRKHFSVKGFFIISFLFIKNFFFLIKLNTKYKFDLLYTNTAGIFLGPVFSKLFGITHVWHIHEIISKPIFLKKTISFISRKISNYNIAVSNAVKHNLYNNKKSVSNNCDVIYNGFDWSSFAQDFSSLKNSLDIHENEIVVSYIGRIHFWKGYDIFLEAAALALQKNSNIKFLIVGDVFPGYEDLRDVLLNFIKKRRLENKIFFLGFRDDAPKIMNISDIIVIPSILPDPLPTTVLEGMASGKTVIGSDIGGIPEMIKHNSTGLLFKPGDSKELADNIINLIENPDLMTKYGDNAKKFVNEQFSLEKFRENILRKFKEITL